MKLLSPEKGRSDPPRSLRFRFRLRPLCQYVIPTAPNIVIAVARCAWRSRFSMRPSEAQTPATRTAATISSSVGKRPYWEMSSGDGLSIQVQRTTPERSSPGCSGGRELAIGIVMPALPSLARTMARTGASIPTPLSFFASIWLLTQILPPLAAPQRWVLPVRAA